jgi:plastocyanin
MRLSHRAMSTLTAFATAAAMLLPGATYAANAPSAVFSPGDLIKSSANSSVYYYASNGKRYVFPNEKTYFTWYKDFSNVKTLSVAQLGAIGIGGNVTYKPGSRMVKVTTDPRVYVVDQGGVLRHVASEQLANTLYGLNWQDAIHDLPDAFFTNYRIGTAIQTASDFKPADVSTLTPTIAEDKQLDKNVATVTIGDPDTIGYVPTTMTIKAGTKVTWTNNDSIDHTVTGNGWTSGQIMPGASYSYTFNSVGSFDYHCLQHPASQGTINVVN